jgi:capsular polysaccharide transport system ATP-binding protein
MIVFRDVTAVVSSGRIKSIVLENVSLMVPTDQNLVVLGREGSGKTTLIRLLAGAVSPTSGTIERYVRVSFPVGFAGGLNRSLSVLHNVSHVARLYGADAEEVVAFVAALSGIRDELHESYGNLPQQLQRKLAYALSYAIPFDVYLIDDRIAMGDNEFRSKCEYVFEQRMRTSGFILTSSVPRYAKRFAKKAAILQSKKISFYDDIDRAIWDFERLAAPPAQADGPEGEGVAN